jgi:hypothetical protein
MVDLAASSRRRQNLERHGESGWYEWTLREFLRYAYGVGILAIITFVPLQLRQSWLPDQAPPIVNPAIAVAFGALVIAGIFAAAVLVYRALWGDGGWVDRNLERRRRPSGPNGKAASRP